MNNRQFRKLMSLLLVFVMLTELLPANIFAVPEEGNPSLYEEAPLDEPDIQFEEVEAENQESEATVLGEMTELREEYVKHFRMDDGTYTAITYDEPVHYEDDNGEWQDIDNSLYYNENGDENATMKPAPAVSASPLRNQSPKMVVSSEQ